MKERGQGAGQDGKGTVPRPLTECEPVCPGPGESSVFNAVPVLQWP